MFITQEDISKAREKLGVELICSSLCKVENSTLYLFPLIVMTASVSPVLASYVQIIRDKARYNMLEENEYTTFRKFAQKRMLYLFPVDFVVGFIAGLTVPIPHSYYMEQGLKNRLQLGEELSCLRKK